MGPDLGCCVALPVLLSFALLLFHGGISFDPTFPGPTLPVLSRFDGTDLLSRLSTKNRITTNSPLLTLEFQLSMTF